MIAYKGFNQDMTCTLGHGRFQYQIGVTVDESETGAKCANYGLHCAEDPLDVLNYYRSPESSRYFIVKAEGDIHEDARDSRIACTKLTPVKELSIQKLALHACHFMISRPEREPNSRVWKEKGTADKYFAIVRGKKPMARGDKGATLFLLQEDKDSKEIIEFAAYEVDGVEIKEDTYYDIDGREVKQCDKSRAKKTAHA